jgi:hypothetical protein
VLKPLSSVYKQHGTTRKAGLTNNRRLRAWEQDHLKKSFLPKRWIGNNSEDIIDVNFLLAHIIIEGHVS